MRIATMGLLLTAFAVVSSPAVAGTRGESEPVNPLEEFVGIDLREDIKATARCICRDGGVFQLDPGRTDMCTGKTTLAEEPSVAGFMLVIAPAVEATDEARRSRAL